MKVSLFEVVQAMSDGGWLDLNSGRTLNEEVFDMDGTCRIMPVLHGELVDVNKEPNRFVRIPCLSDAYLCKMLITKHKLPSLVLEKHGITESDMTKEYQLYQEHEVESKSDSTFSSKATLMFDELGIAVNYKYLVDIARDWCSKHGFDVEEDCNRYPFTSR